MKSRPERARRAQLLRLQKFYTIKGDGVAQLRLDEVASEPRFKQAIQRLSNLTLEPETEHEAERGHDEASFAQ